MKTAHRNASRAKRREYPLIPKFWQPKVKPESQSTVQVIHWDLVTRFANGSADEEIMWDWIEAGLTYSEMMRLLQADGTPFTDEALAGMAELLEIQPSVRRRFAATGRVGFTGAELNIARAAAYLMDDLITMDRHGIAWAARQWSDEQMAKLKRIGNEPLIATKTIAVSAHQ